MLETQGRFCHSRPSAIAMLLHKLTKVDSQLYYDAISFSLKLVK